MGFSLTAGDDVFELAARCQALEVKLGKAKGEAHGWWTRAFVAEERLIWAFKELGRARDLLAAVAKDADTDGSWRRLGFDWNCQECGLAGATAERVANFLAEVTDGSSEAIPKHGSPSSPGQGETLPPGT